MSPDILNWVYLFQQLVDSFVMVALLFVSYEYHRRYLLSKTTHSKAAQAIYNDLRVLFLLLGVTFAIASMASPIPIVILLGTLAGLASGLWGAKIAFGRFLPKDLK